MKSRVDPKKGRIAGLITIVLGVVFLVLDNVISSGYKFLFLGCFFLIYGIITLFVPRFCVYLFWWSFPLVCNSYPEKVDKNK